MASNMKTVAIIGSGNWGSAISVIVGKNVKENPGFNHEVKMWVFEELVDGRKLTEIINETHENVKYLKGFSIPENVKACSCVKKTVTGADILIFVLPHQFIRRTCKEITGLVKDGAIAISLIKGMDTTDGKIKLISEVINSLLEVDVSVLMGANIALDVAQGDFCESTIGSRSEEQGALLKSIFNRSTFKVNVVSDVAAVELCGALKNIVAVAAGFSDGLGYGASTKAAIIRLGLLEMWRFIKLYFGGHDMHTLFESCGVADLIATCSGGRNRKVSEAFVKTGKPIEVLEAEMLNGQKLQGPMTAKEVYEALVADGNTVEFPVFSAVYKICFEGLPASNMLKTIAVL